MEKPIKIGLLGAGTVGSGVLQVLHENAQEVALKAGAPVKVKAVLVRDAKKTRPHMEDLLVTDKIEDILEDEEIQIVVELMGGLKPAREYMLAAMEAGKHVVTANKDVIAQFGKEMFETAEKNNVGFLFEASVGGGIPIIRPIMESLTAGRRGGDPRPISDGVRRGACRISDRCGAGDAGAQRALLYGAGR